MTLQDTYNFYFAKLKEIYPAGEARAINDALFEHFVKLNFSYLQRRWHEPTDNFDFSHLPAAIERLARHEPVQHITECAWFFGLHYFVNKDVLIPRPETEELVEKIIEHGKLQAPPVRIFEIGTGSGCISIAIKKNLPAAEITAVDISSDALAVAKNNADIHSAKINFIQMDFLDESEWRVQDEFDIIVSNPPYIPEGEESTLPENVRLFEPHTALFAPQNNPLLFYKKIRAFSDEHLTSGGKVFLEVHEKFAEEAAALFKTGAFTAEIITDMSGKQRMIMSTRCP